MWHWVYDGGVPKGQPTPTRCPDCPSSPASATSSAPATSPPATTPASTPAATPPATAPPAVTPTPGGDVPQLALTGPPLWYLLLGGSALLLAGVLFVALARPRRRTRRPVRR